jgi:hypothetical protein
VKQVAIVPVINHLAQAFEPVKNIRNHQIAAHGVKYIARRFIVADHRLIK